MKYPRKITQQQTQWSNAPFLKLLAIHRRSLPGGDNSEEAMHVFWHVNHDVAVLHSEEAVGNRNVSPPIVRHCVKYVMYLWNAMFIRSRLFYAGFLRGKGTYEVSNRAQQNDANRPHARQHLGWHLVEISLWKQRISNLNSGVLISFLPFFHC